MPSCQGARLFAFRWSRRGAYHEAQVASGSRLREDAETETPARNRPTPAFRYEGLFGPLDYVPPAEYEANFYRSQSNPTEVAGLM